MEPISNPIDNKKELTERLSAFGWLVFTIGILLMLGAMIERGCRRIPTSVTPVTHTDTLYRSEIKHDTVRLEAGGEPAKIMKPNKLVVYLHDTLYRERVVHDTIITGVQLTGNKLDVDIIAPDGKEETKVYNMPALPDTLNINRRGDANAFQVYGMPKKKELTRWQKTRNIGLVILGSGIVGYALHK